MLQTKFKFLIWLSALFSSVALADPLPVVNKVDPNRYMGLWYEIATIPQYFERNCASDTTAEYSILAPNRVKVVNSCSTEEHKRIEKEGRAKVTDAQTNAKLKVTFAHLGDQYFFSFGGKYWITYLDPNYEYVIVGHPSRRYGWILSRTPSLPESTLRALISELKMRGYNSCQFIMTPQKDGYVTKGRLCDMVAVDTLEQEL